MAVISQLAYEVIKSHSLIMSKVFKGILSAKISSQVDTKSSAEESFLLMDSEELLPQTFSITALCSQLQNLLDYVLFYIFFWLHSELLCINCSVMGQ